MTGILVALLGVLWAVVLLPVLLSARQNTSVTGSVGTFSRSMRALGSNHIQPSMGGRWVLTPRPPEDEADRKMTMLRRRRVFCSMVGTLCFTLFLGMLPTMRPMLWVAMVAGLSLGAYVYFLIQQKQRTPAYRRLAPVAAAEPRGGEDIPTVLRLAYTPPARFEAGGRRVHRILDESLDDDGLGELSWLKAGRN
ncbi:MAG: hypothetical protein ACT4OM_10475 [Actinomycetota bacterium]